MPVIRSGDHHGVDGFVVQQFVKVRIFGGRRAGLLDGEVHVVVAQVADGGGLLVAIFEKRIVDLVAAVAQADVAHADAVIGAENAGIAERRRKYGALGEVTSCNHGHSGVEFQDILILNYMGAFHHTTVQVMRFAEQAGVLQMLGEIAVDM